MAIGNPSEMQHKTRWIDYAAVLIDEADASPGEWVFNEEAPTGERESTGMKAAVHRIIFARTYESRMRQGVQFIRLIDG